MVKEFQSLGLDLKVLTKDKDVVTFKELPEEDREIPVQDVPTGERTEIDIMGNAPVTGLFDFEKGASVDIGFDINSLLDTDGDDPFGFGKKKD